MDSLAVLDVGITLSELLWSVSGLLEDPSLQSLSLKKKKCELPALREQN